MTESLNGDCVWAAVARNMVKLNKIWRPLWLEIWQQKCRVEGCMAYGASEWAAMAYLQKEGKWYQDNASCHTCFIVYSHITHNLHCIHKTYIHTSYISQCLYTCYTSALITKHCSDILVLYSRFRVSWYTKHAHIFFVLTNMPSQNNVTRQVPWCQLHKFLIWPLMKGLKIAFRMISMNDESTDVIIIIIIIIINHQSSSWPSSSSSSWKYSGPEEREAIRPGGDYSNRTLAPDYPLGTPPPPLHNVCISKYQKVCRYVVYHWVHHPSCTTCV